MCNRSAALLAFAFAIGCSPQGFQDRGGGASSGMGGGGTPPPRIPPTLPAPRVEYLGEIASPELLSPTRIAIGADDAIIVSDAMGGDVHVFSPRGTQRARIPGFRRPLAVGAGSRGELYVGDGADGSVRIVDRTGRALGAFGKGEGELSMPSDLAVDPVTGEVYVVDSRRDQVRVFTADGTPARAFLSKGSGPGEVSFPTGILFEPANGLRVVDQRNARIQRFSTDGALRTPVLGGFSSAPGGLVRPQGIARDALGRLYVTDAFQWTVQVLDPNGAHLAYVGVPGKGAGQLALPSDVVVDRFGRLLVASFDTGKVLVFGLDDWTPPPEDVVGTGRGRP